MANDTNYEYVNEAAIDTELICSSICKAPLIDPVCTPCDHTFCRKCITGWGNTGNVRCPACNQQLASIDNLPQATRLVRNMLDRLPVKCTFCGKTGLERGNFSDHISKECSKVHVSCPSADIKCPWKGPRDQLNNHIETCVQPFRIIITELTAKTRQLEEQVKQLTGE
jgi:ubiquitin conjugation factor E4 B